MTPYMNIYNTGREQVSHTEEAKNAVLYGFLALFCRKVVVKQSSWNSLLTIIISMKLCLQFFHFSFITQQCPILLKCSCTLFFLFFNALLD